MYLFLNYILKDCNKLTNSIFKFDVLYILVPRNNKFLKLLQAEDIKEHYLEAEHAKFSV